MDAPDQPESGRWLWRDANGNGRFDAGEYTKTEGPSGEYWASNVDPRGDLWQAGATPVSGGGGSSGSTSTATPKYDPKPSVVRCPPPFNDLLRTEYDPATDTMWLTGQTKDRPISERRVGHRRDRRGPI